MEVNMLNAKYEPTATSEMRRRQDAVLKSMAGKGIDAIIACNFGDMVAGPFKYLTDRSHYYTMAMIMSPEGIVIYYSRFENPPDKKLVFEPNGEALPIALWSAPYVPGIYYNKDRFAEAMTHYIKSRGLKKVGWVGFSYIPANIYQYLISNNPGVEFVDFTDDLDDIRLVKSEYEISRFARVVDMHDRLERAIHGMIRRQITPHALNLEMMHTAAKIGAVEFNTGLMRHWRNIDGKDVDLGLVTPLEVGDYLWVLIEVAGVNGEWGEIARLYRLGEEPEQKYLDISNNLLKITAAVAKACVPGAIPEEVFALNNKLLTDCGYPVEERLCIHGQTYDIVDLPMFTKGDRKPLKENMFFTIHPGYQSSPGSFDAPYMNYTDNYLVKPGGAVRLNKIPMEIFTIGI